MMRLVRLQKINEAKRSSRQPGLHHHSPASTEIGKKNIPGIVYLGLDDCDKNTPMFVLTPHSIKAYAVGNSEPCSCFPG